MKLTMHRGHSHLQPDEVLAFLLLLVIAVTVIGAVLIFWHLPLALPIDWSPGLYPA
jgi:hypothetical protein